MHNAVILESSIWLIRASHGRFEKDIGNSLQKTKQNKTKQNSLQI